MNTGFGSPSANVPIGQHYDIGFGSPGLDSVAEEDWGFGDQGAGATQVLVVVPVVTNNEWPDDGGVVLYVKADWKAMGPGPYQVRLRESFTSTFYPKDKFGCWSTIPGNPWQCVPNALFTELAFAVPPVPPGVYDVVVNYGPALGTQKETLKAIRVIWRGRQSQVYSLRRHLVPGWKSAGSRAPRADILLGV